MTLIAEEDPSRPIPPRMRHWFQKIGVYPRKAFGLHRSWRRDKMLFVRTSKPRFVAGTRDGVRYFRVLPHINRMDICDGYFDRWANSLGASVPMPTTEVEFKAAIEKLLRKSRKRVAETWPDPCESCGAPLPQGECNDCAFDGLADA